MRKITSLVLILVMVFMLGSCGDFLKNLLDNFNTAPPLSDDFTEVDLEETVAKFTDGTYKNVIFGGEGLFNYKVELTAPNDNFLLDYNINVPYNSFGDKFGIAFSEVDDEVILSGRVDISMESVGLVDLSLYVTDGTVYADIKELEMNTLVMEEGKYYDANMMLVIFVSDIFSDCDVMNLAEPDSEVTADDIIEKISKIKTAEKNNLTYYEITLKDGVIGDLMDPPVGEIEDYTYRIIYTLSGNDIIGFSLEMENEKEDAKLEVSAKKLKISNIVLPSLTGYNEPFSLED